MADEETKKDEKKKAPRKKKAPARKEEAPAAVAEPVKAEAPAHAATPAEPEPEARKPLRKKPKARKSPRVFVTRGKRKASVARATIQAGKGVLRVNCMALSALNNKYVQEIIREPLTYLGPEANSVDISVDVRGGGVMSGAQAARTAIARALSMYFEDLNLKDKFNSIDRSLIVEDTRRVESKKYSGPKARARYQKSYR